MFNRYAIKNLHIEVLDRVNEMYSGNLELLYYYEKVKRETGINVYSTFDYRSFKQDVVETKRFQENLVGNNDHGIYFFLIFKKTEIKTDDTDYREIWHKTKQDRRYYWSDTYKNLFVFIEKKIEWTSNGCYYNFLDELFEYDRIYNLQHIDYTNEDWYTEFMQAWHNYDQLLMQNWLKKYFPKNEDPRIYEDKIKQFFSKANENQIERIQADIRRNIDSMRNYLNSYNRENQELNANRAKLLAYQNQTGCQDELINIFKDMPNAKIVDVEPEENEMIFTVETSLTSFDPEKMEELLRCDNNYVSWRNCTGRYDNETRKKILGAIFCESPRYVLQVKQAFTMSPNMDIYAKRGYEIEENYIANPHLNMFSCFGGNGVYIQQAFHENDFAQGIALLTASVANVNLMEDISMKYLWADLFENRRNNKFILDNETGELISVEELVEKLNNPEEEKDEFAEEVKRVSIPVDVFNPEEAPVEEPAVDPYEDPIEVLREMDQVEEEMTEPTEADVEATRRLIEQRRANQNMREAVADMNAALDENRDRNVTLVYQGDVERELNIFDEIEEDINNQLAVEYTEEEFDREFVPTFNQADRNEYRWRDTV